MGGSFQTSLESLLHQTCKYQNLSAPSVSQNRTKRVKVKVLVSSSDSVDEGIVFKVPSKRLPKGQRHQGAKCKPLGVKLQQSIARIEKYPRTGAAIKKL